MCCSRHFRGEEPDLELERLIAVYLRRVQGDHGGWPLVHAGAVRHERQRQGLFCAEDDRRRSRGAAHAPRARGDPWPRRRGEEQRLHPLPAGALRRIPWRGVPTMPVEIMLLPRWFPFHLDKVSYWARTVMVPLLVLQALKPRARQPARRHDPGAVRRAAGNRARVAEGRASGWAGSSSSARSTGCSSASSLFPDLPAPPRDRRGRGFRDRAPQWRGRPRRDLSRRWRTPS